MTLFLPTVELVPYADQAAAFPAPPRGWLMHVQAGDNDPFGWWAGLVSPDRAFAHYWISKTGACRQYQELARQSWAQGTGGNPLYWSVEFEGWPTEPLTAAQIITGAQLHNSLKVADQVTNTPGGTGVGTHGMGGAAYGGHPDCPGPLRAAQRLPIINFARKLRGAQPVPGPAPTFHVPAGNAAQVKLIQTAVHVAVDGVFGPQTLNAANAVIRKDTSNVRFLQARVGATVDGVWGKNSNLAWTLAIQRLQAAVGALVDGVWGPHSQSAWQILLAAQGH